tara:strand:+ start:730 stop:1068 length:339 start_codon:yes stop_codon:yes gene_type:complete
MIKQAEIDQAYILGRQAALEKLAGFQSDIKRNIKQQAFADATGGLNEVPYRRASNRDIANKYNISKDEATAIGNRGEAAAEEAYRFARALGENNSQRAFGLPHGTARVPYRN